MVDVEACLRRGAIGAIGAVPGTIAAHPFDVLKMRQQVSGETLAVTLRRVRASPGGFVAGLYNGVGAGVMQKVFTRGPMFLASEVCTQLCIEHAGMSRDRALVVGSFGSGYITGFLAAPAEWAKVQRGVGVTRRGGVGETLARLSQPAAFRRLHGCGLRNGIFDSVFFGVEHGLRTDAGLPPAVSYAAAAALALTVDYPVDVAVKRSMAADGHVRWPLVEARRLWRTRGLATFVGLRIKVCEFAASYFVTGGCSRYVAAAFGG